MVGKMLRLVLILLDLLLLSSTPEATEMRPLFIFTGNIIIIIVIFKIYCIVADLLQSSLIMRRMLLLLLILLKIIVFINIWTQTRSVVFFDSKLIIFHDVFANGTCLKMRRLQLSLFAKIVGLEFLRKGDCFFL